MKSIHQTVRLSPAQFRQLIALADGHELSRYAALGRVIAAGFDALAQVDNNHANSREIADEVANIGIQLAEIERLLDRALFTACAAYTYSRNAALQRKVSDTTAVQEIEEAFARQRAIGLGDQP